MYIESGGRHVAYNIIRLQYLDFSSQGLQPLWDPKYESRWVTTQGNILYISDMSVARKTNIYLGMLNPCNILNVKYFLLRTKRDWAALTLTSECAQKQRAAHRQVHAVQSTY